MDGERHERDELSPDELEAERGEELPDREAMSVADLGDSLGPPPLAE